VRPCGAGLCAVIAAPKSAVDPETGRLWTDRHNHDPALRGRALVGVPVLYGLVPEAPGRWSGELYNVDNGNVYTGHLLELGPRTIRVEGCAIGIWWPEHDADQVEGDTAVSELSPLIPAQAGLDHNPRIAAKKLVAASINQFGNVDPFSSHILPGCALSQSSWLRNNSSASFTFWSRTMGSCAV
jgi:Uncharacterized protein conserved in bacteria (DUF2147)